MTTTDAIKESALHTTEKKQSEQLLATIESPLRIGVKDTLRTIGFSTKSSSLGSHSHHIGTDLEKFEEKLIQKRKPKIE